MDADEAPRKKAGRPAKFPKDGKRIVHSLRLKEAIRDRLLTSAAANERSISEELEARVDRSFEPEAMFGDVQSLTLMLLIGRTIELIEKVSGRGRRWFEDPLVAAACHSAINQAVGMAMQVDRLNDAYKGLADIFGRGEVIKMFQGIAQFDDPQTQRMNQHFMEEMRKARPDEAAASNEELATLIEADQPKPADPAGPKRARKVKT